MSLDQQAALTAGVDFWQTAAAGVVGLRGIVVSNGPNGARGPHWMAVSVCTPSATALAATWDRRLVQRIGEVLGDEARSKGAHVLLAPTVNIHRHPVGGRNFECFSEDPRLSADMSVAFVRGVQSRGVGCAIKHLVCNDQEFERMSIDVEVDERPLREIYLAPFEAAVRESDVFMVMSSYNKLRGKFCSENRDLLISILKEEWGFDGVVVSDWFGTHSTSALGAGLDLEMPGPASFLGDKLVDAVVDGTVSVEAVREAAGRVLQLMRRVGSPGPAAESSTEERAVLVRQAAAEGVVLLKNESSLLPLDPATISRLAVAGPAAARLCAQGGGAAEVTPPYVRSPLEAIAGRSGDMIVTFEPGCTIPGTMLPLGPPVLRTEDGHEGVGVQYFDSDDLTGEPVHRDVFTVSQLLWLGTPHPAITPGKICARATTVFSPDRTGTWDFGVFATGEARLYLDGALLLDNSGASAGEGFFGFGRAEMTRSSQLTEGIAYTLTVEFRADNELPIAGVSFGAAFRPPENALASAANAARAADLALLVVGTDNRWETEGKDRESLRLPGDQDALIRAVAAANPRTVVVVNSGAPVEMPWAEDVEAIVQVWYPGQEGGSALVDVLFGDVDASGRLPTTFPVHLEDAPAFPFYPGDGQTLRYGEGIYVGYRHYDSKGVEPRFCFGHGLSYTTFSYENLAVGRLGSEVEVSVDVTNTGTRRGAEVIQVYARRPESRVERPDKELKGFEKIWLQPGETTRVHLRISEQDFRHWDEAEDSWEIERGEVEILVGASSRDIRLSAAVSL
ncbi:MAG TPA: glycoside hydrolase family 3 C-terminal domain-containing protein [Acidimicrobiales bacterium]